MGCGPGLRFFFVLTALTRITVSVGLLDRPLVVGFLAGLVTGRLDAALPVAVILELFWLDIIRLGAVVPPSGTFSFLLIFPLILLLNLELPGQLPLPLMLCLPLAYSVAWLEKRHRQQANAYADSVARWCRNGKGISPGTVMGRAVCRVAWTHFVLYLFCFTVVYGLCVFLTARGALPVFPRISWNLLYGVGLMGAVLALRVRHAYAVLGCALVFLVFQHM